MDGVAVEYIKHKNTIKTVLEENNQLKNEPAKLKITTEIQAPALAVEPVLDKVACHKIGTL